MRSLWIIFIWVNVLGLSPAFAQLYRWTDETGQVHITDDPSTIPAAQRDQPGVSTTAPAAPADQRTTPQQPPLAPQRPRPPAGTAQPSPFTHGPSPSLRQRVQTLQQEIATARQQRQTYLDRLRSTRTVHTTPEFVRHRRQIGELGRALVAVEQRLDTLEAEHERLQSALATQAPSLAVQRTQQEGFDAAGRNAAYWHRRAQPIRTQLDEAQSQRRDLLAQLTAITTDDNRPAERQGRNLLMLAEQLQQVETSIDRLEQAWQTLRQEATRAAIPPDWLQ
ncbi:MAG: DUF4124 domain-containing protein [Candidatus Tectimicrobiota bacterium]